MQLLPISLSIGILVGIWTFVSVTYDILTWPCLIGWAVFILLGANKEAVLKAVPPMIVGLILAYLTVQANNALNGSLLMTSSLFCGLAFLLTFLMNISWLACAPAAFAAVGCFFAAGGDPIKAGIPMIIGVLLGYLSFWIVDVLVKPDKDADASITAGDI